MMIDFWSTADLIIVLGNNWRNDLTGVFLSR